MFSNYNHFVQKGYGNFEDDDDDIESSQESEQSSSKFPMTTSFIAIDGGTAAKHNGTL